MLYRASVTENGETTSRTFLFQPQKFVLLHMLALGKLQLGKVLALESDVKRSRASAEAANAGNEILQKYLNSWVSETIQIRAREKRD